MVHARLVGEAASPFVRMLRRAASPREPDAEFFEDRQRAWHDGIARIAETDGLRNAVFGAPGIDGFDLLAQLAQCSRRDAQMIARVIADLETIIVQFPDLFPRQVILLVRAKRKS